MFDPRVVKGVIMALIAVILWSGNFIIAKNLINDVSPITLSLLRWSTACVVVLPFAFKALIKDWSIIKKHLKFHMLISFIGISIFNTIVYLSAHHASSINMIIFSATAPISTMLLSTLFFKDPLGFFKVLGLIFAFLGVVLIASKGELDVLLNLQFSYGDALALLSPFLFALYSVLLRFTPKEESQLGFLSSIFILGVLFLIPMSAAELYYGGVVNLTGHGVVWSVLYVGVGASVVSYFLWNAAIACIGPFRTSLIYYTLPLFGVLWAIIFLDEHLLLTHIIGGLLVFLGIAVANKRQV